MAVKACEALVSHFNRFSCAQDAMNNTELHSIVCCSTGMKERNETEKFLSPEGTGKGFSINKHLLCSFSFVILERKDGHVFSYTNT